MTFPRAIFQGHSELAMKPKSIYKMTRVLEYEGPLEWLKHTFTNNYVKGEIEIGCGGCHIREVSVTKPEKVEDDPERHG